MLSLIAIGGKMDKPIPGLRTEPTAYQFVSYPNKPDCRVVSIWHNVHDLAEKFDLFNLQRDALVADRFKSICAAFRDASSSEQFCENSAVWNVIRSRDGKRSVLRPWLATIVRAVRHDEPPVLKLLVNRQAEAHAVS